MGTLSGITVLELLGLGPAPMAGMMLADMGAEVICIEREGPTDPLTCRDISMRGKKSVVLDLKSEENRALFLKLVGRADVLIDPYRPGVCERLGIGPDVCCKLNPRLVFARMTGWGQDGPLAAAAGHDLNYIAITGALHAIGPADAAPSVPLNLIGDMGGGAMLLVQGILAAIVERAGSGRGQIVDAAMVDGAAQLMWMFHSLQASGHWDDAHRARNLLDGGAHFYGVYECADGRYLSLAAIEPKFYRLLLELLGLDSAQFSQQNDRARWPEYRAAIARRIKTKTQAEWTRLLAGSDACVAPVLTLSEAAHHPANQARRVYVHIEGVTQPAPAPRFSRTPSNVHSGAPQVGKHTHSVLASLSEPDAQDLEATWDERKRT